MKTINISGHLCVFDKDADVANLSVCVQPSGYKVLVYSAGPNVSKRYCRIYTGAPKNLEVDHINGNTLDNRKENLRLVTSQQNKFNQIKKGSKSGLPKGVCKHGKNFKASITFNYTTYSLGTFLSPEEAEAAYLKAAEKFFGEFAKHISRKR